MSRFFSERHRGLKPYEPGEQPQIGKYIKLNTNESPFPPSAEAVKRASEAAKDLMLYSDPDFRNLSQKLAKHFGVKSSNVLVGNGSDEILNFAFMAFCDENRPAIFPDITYGFYPVFADMNAVPYVEIALKEDLSINAEDYYGAKGTIFLANPNAHTGIALEVGEIEEIIKQNPGQVLVVDEAYVDFGTESCVELTSKYDNLVVVQTFSKSRSLAGARVGFCIADEELIRDMNTLRNSTNPYNINSMTMAAAEGALEEEDYNKANCAEVLRNREYTEKELLRLDFEMTPSSANFLFAKHPWISGERIYEELKAKGVLVRHFSKERIREYNRITIGSKKEMEIFIRRLEEVIAEAKNNEAEAAAEAGHREAKAAAETKNKEAPEEGGR